MKHIRGRKKVQQDIYHIIEFYRDESPVLAVRFVEEIHKASARIEAMPSLGSLRFASELGMRGLRMYLVQGFPYVLLYLEREDHIDLVRVLHTHRDILDLLLGDG